MKICLISQATRGFLNDKGDVYTNAHMDREVVKRYSDICSDLKIVIRNGGNVYTCEEAEKKYNPFPIDLAEVKVGYNPHAYFLGFLNIKKMRQLYKMINTEIEKADRIIIASASGFYSNYAIKVCKRKRKMYMILVGGFNFESFWYHSLKGKILAARFEYTAKKNIRNAPYVIYVTEKALQMRYPTFGKVCGCSDVDLIAIEDEVLEERIQRINNGNIKYIIGTAAGLDISWKGQKIVIQALALLKKRGIDNIEYQLIGGGCGEKLIQYAKKNKIDNQIKIVGSLPHSKVFKWMRNLDIYVQPSYTEGLCRSIVEAMSMSVPIICTNVGGNFEMVEKECLFKKGDANALAKAIQSMMNADKLIYYSKRSHDNSKNYSKSMLDQKRTNFLNEFIKNL